MYLLTTCMVCLAVVLCMVSSSSAESTQNLSEDSIPSLRRNGQAIQLMVDGKPYLILGGELHNSSSSNLEYMKPIWPKLATMNLNTVLAVVSWELSEPEEGKFEGVFRYGEVCDFF